MKNEIFRHAVSVLGIIAFCLALCGLVSEPNAGTSVWAWLAWEVGCIILAVAGVKAAVWGNPDILKDEEV